MLRSILSVIAGYVAMVLFVFIALTVAAIALGDRAYRAPGSWQVSTLWLCVSFALGLIAAILGGWLCAIIARPSRRPPIILAGVVLVLGLIMGIATMMMPDPEAPEARPADASPMEGFTSAKTPTVALLLNPVIGVAGVLIGASLVKRTRAPQA